LINRSSSDLLPFPDSTNGGSILFEIVFQKE
jgi:hypothetical protein